MQSKFQPKFLSKKRHQFCSIWLPWQPNFFKDDQRLKEFERGSPKEHSCETWLISDQQFLRRRFFKFLAFGFFMDYQTLKESERGRPKVHSCEIWLKLTQWLKRRRLLNKLTKDARLDLRRHTDARHSIIPIPHFGTLCQVSLKPLKV